MAYKTTAILSIVLFAVGTRAGAQTTAWRDHALVSINVGTFQPATGSFIGTTSKSIYLETATTSTTYSIPRGLPFDGGVLIRIGRNFGVGAAVSSFSKSADAAVTGNIPHPFFFNTPRAISGSVSALGRKEVAAHIQAGYVIASGKVVAAITGGPSFFTVTQDLVSDVSFSEIYPYDTATFTSATTTSASANKVGFNAGVDIGVKFSAKVGVGGLVRFSRASVTFPASGAATSVVTDVGGLQAGGGIRFYF